MCCVKSCSNCAECLACQAARMCAKCAKYLLFVVNVIFFLCGAVLLSMGLFFRFDPRAHGFLEVVEDSTKNPLLEYCVYIMIGIGAFIFLLGFMGCCGACCDNPSMLCCYVFLIIIAIIGQIVIAILAIIKKDELNLALLRGMADQVNIHYTGHPHNDTVTVAFNKLQIDVSCCGSNGFQDYQNSFFTKTTNKVVPETCCFLDTRDPYEPIVRDWEKCQDEARTLNAGSQSLELHSTGCYHRLLGWINERSAIIGGVACGIVLFQILCVIFACCIRKSINRDVSAVL